MRLNLEPRPSLLRFPFIFSADSFSFQQTRRISDKSLVVSVSGIHNIVIVAVVVMPI